MYNTTWFDEVLDERQQTCGGGVDDASHSDPTNTAAIFLGRHGDQGFLAHPSAMLTPFSTAHIRLVYLDGSGEPVSDFISKAFLNREIAKPKRGVGVTSEGVAGMRRAFIALLAYTDRLAMSRRQTVV